MLYTFFGNSTIVEQLNPKLSSLRRDTKSLLLYSFFSLSLRLSPCRRVSGTNWESFTSWWHDFFPYSFFNLFNALWTLPPHWVSLSLKGSYVWIMTQTYHTTYSRGVWWSYFSMFFEVENESRYFASYLGPFEVETWHEINFLEGVG